MNAHDAHRPRKAYIVLTGDIVSSRAVARRDSLQARVRQLLARLSKEFSEIVAVPLTISGGDEFQGLFKLDGRVVSLVRCVQSGLHPVVLRVGVGIGAISTRFAPRSQEMDGEAFAFSREAVLRARKHDAWLWFRTANPDFDLAANAIALLSGSVKSRWKQVHWRRAALRDKGWTTTKIARREGVSQAAVSLSLTHAGYPAVSAAEASLAELTSRFTEVKPTGL